MSHIYRSIGFFLFSQIPGTGTVIGGSIAIAGIASATTVGSLFTSFSTEISTVEIVDTTNMGKSMIWLNNKTFQKDGSEARFNFPYLSTESAGPRNITLTAPNDIILVSVNDSNYLPITGPDGTADPTVDFQGSITTTGRTVLIPYTVTGSTSTLSAYSQSFTVDASDTEDGQSRTLTLSYPEQSLSVGSGTITATLKAEEGTFNAKKLDIDQHYQPANWLEFASFTIPLDDQNTATITAKVAPGIPDANFGDGEHDFLYTLVTATDGTVWLNNNLGAEYNNINSPHFNPFKQATSSIDYLAYGSLFQWGRPADGHELRSCTDATTCTSKYGSTKTISESISPGHNSFIIIPSYPSKWTTTDFNGFERQAFWAKSDGTGICPVGFRVPSRTELNVIKRVENIKKSNSFFFSVLKGTLAGFRDDTNASFINLSSGGYLWSESIVFVTNLELSEYYSTVRGYIDKTAYRGHGYSVRCRAD